MNGLQVPYPGGHSHVRIQGKFTKALAVYQLKLAEFIAMRIKDALLNQAPETESVILNDMQQPGWEV